MSNLTVIIAASAIKSHPKSDLIKQTVNSLNLIKYGEKSVLDYCDILLSHDGFPAPSNKMRRGSVYHGRKRIYRTRGFYSLGDKSEENYNKYINELKESYKDKSNINIIVKDTWGNLTGNIRNSMRYVKTDYVLIMQHDLPFCEELEIGSVIEDMQNNNQLKHIRFNRMINGEGDEAGESHKPWGKFGNAIKTNKNTYISTPVWSDNNHICKKEYYDSIILEEVEDGYAMEVVLFPQNTRNNHAKYGTYIFGELESGPYIKHTDARQKPA